MDKREEIKEAIFRAIDDMNELLPKGRKMKKNLEVVIFGEGGLDSLDLINFLVAVEGKVEGQFGMAISLLNEKAMADMNSYERTTGGLVDYLLSLLNKIE